MTQPPQVINREYLVVPVETLHPHPQNYNRGDLDAIEESMDANGFFGVVTVHDHPEITGEWQILAGEHRWKKAKELGLLEIPIVVVDVEDPVHAARILLSDNETAKRSTYDNASLSDLLRSLGNVKGTGFNLAGLEAVEDERRASEPPEDDDPEQFAREYGIVVYAADEAEQESIYNQCRELGWRVRVASI